MYILYVCEVCLHHVCGASSSLHKNKIVRKLFAWLSFYHVIATFYVSSSLSHSLARSFSLLAHCSPRTSTPIFVYVNIEHMIVVAHKLRIATTLRLQLLNIIICFGYLCSHMHNTHAQTMICNI